MRNPYWRLSAIVRLAVITLFALVIATPASAQFGGLKKKIKSATGQEDKTRPAAAGAEAPGDQGGTIVLTPEVVDQLITGLKAGVGEREAAAKADTPYGRYKKAESAYAEAQTKCKAGQQTFAQRAAANEKMMAKYNALTEKMLAAQGKGDMKLMAVYQDSAMAMQDPSCVVKKPDQPEDYYDAEREIEVRAEAVEAKAAGFSMQELAVVKERATAIVSGHPQEDISASEKAAVSAKSAELKPLLGFREQPAIAKKPEPAPAPTPTAAPASPQMSAGAMSMSECMSKNAQTHQAELEALGKRAEAAQAAGDTPKLMAIVDTLQQIQMAGCQKR